VKAETSAGAMSAIVGPLHDLGAAVASAALGETLLPGDVLGSGTLPGWCGLEARRLPQPGDGVRLEIEGLATLTNMIGPRPFHRPPA
jgi:2-keto-4-pentenoate hydratase/2-oxohepta-3-ene-1,7-dioic acid hydratase in catechol pathway